MNINVSISAAIRQTMLITRQSIQSVEILQYGQEELEAFVKEQTERNPLIGLSSATPEPRSLSRTGSMRQTSAADLSTVESTVIEKCGLREHLEKQLYLLTISKKQLVLSRYLVGLLDPDGYLRQSLNGISALLDIPEGELESALSVVQKLEPSGVGARNLAECLRLQLIEEGELSHRFARLLESLDLVASGEIERLSKRCNATVDEVKEMLRTLRRLTPAPGQAYDTEPTCPAIPDVVVTVDKAGDLQVDLTAAAVPKVLVDRGYYSQLSSQMCAGSERQFLNDCARDANLLVRNLAQRAATILKITTEIVKRQQGFFLHGVTRMRPLSQKAIAEACNVHESTVSRAISSKFLLCAHGQFPLKFFFTEGLPQANSTDDVASESIRYKIKNLVAAETLKTVLSDDNIASILAAGGIEVARRTVAKYRIQLKIQPSSQRRRMLRLA